MTVCSRSGNLTWAWLAKGFASLHTGQSLEMRYFREKNIIFSTTKRLIIKLAQRETLSIQIKLFCHNELIISRPAKHASFWAKNCQTVSHVRSETLRRPERNLLQDWNSSFVNICIWWIWSDVVEVFGLIDLVDKSAEFAKDIFMFGCLGHVSCPRIITRCLDASWWKLLILVFKCGLPELYSFQGF